IVLLLLVYLGLLDAGTKVQQGFATAYQVSEETTDAGRNTAMSLSSVTVTAGGGRVDANLTNTGAKVIRLYGKVDLVVDYTDGSSVRRIKRLPYHASPQGANEWTYTGISPDSRNPDLLDPQEVAALRVDLTPSMKSATSGVLTITTDGGAMARSTFSY
ncbi:MAG: hypothetical protein HY681_06680, partial [Chloroflexi bacterium]|nr:hypothetical protein [Chloroflexota bacterium]